MLTYIIAPDLPSVKPSAIALGLVFTQAVETAVLAPVLGETYQKAKRANTSREFWESREATSTGIVCSILSFNMSTRTLEPQCQEQVANMQPRPSVPPSSAASRSHTPSAP